MTPDIAALRHHGPAGRKMDGLVHTCATCGESYDPAEPALCGPKVEAAIVRARDEERAAIVADLRDAAREAGRTLSLTGDVVAGTLTACAARYEAGEHRKLKHGGPS